MHLLCIDACVRGPGVSRTWQLAQAFLSAYEKAWPGREIKVLRLPDAGLMPLDHAALLHREALIDQGAWDDPIFQPARDFCEARQILVAAPYWDLSFPAVLKVYVEHIFVRNLTFRYTDAGEPVGLCWGEGLTYLTTSGSPIGRDDWGYRYIRAAAGMLGMKSFRHVSAQGLDIQGHDTQRLMAQAKARAAKAARGCTG